MQPHYLIKIWLVSTCLIVGCTDWDLERKDFPTVVTVGVTNVTTNSAFLVGDLENAEETSIRERGFIYSTTLTDESIFRLGSNGVNKSISSDQGDTRNLAFTADLSGLEGGSLHLFRAYALIEGEEEALYGSINSFTTIGANISITSVEKLVGDCQTTVRIQLETMQIGAAQSDLEYGIHWNNDLFRLPGEFDTEISTQQVDGEGRITLEIQIECDQVYRLRPFVRISSNEVFYGDAYDFASNEGGSWILMGEIPAFFQRTNPINSYSTSQFGYVWGIKQGTIEGSIWRYDPSNNMWSELLNPGTDVSNLSWATQSSSSGVVAGTFFGVQLFEFHSDSEKFQLLSSDLNIQQQNLGFIFNNQLYFNYAHPKWGVLDLNSSSVIQPLDNYPGLANINVRLGFIIDNMVFMGGGIDFNAMKPVFDFWVYDLSSRSWSPIANLPAPMNTRLGFSIGNYGFILNSNIAGPLPPLLGPPDGSFWRYDPIENNWTELTPYGRGDGNASFAFVINGVAYAGLGQSTDGEERQEFWRYVQGLD